MISREQVRTLLERSPNELPVLSVYLDMSVNSENKRTHHLFLNKERARIPELSSDRDNHHREEIGAALARLDAWLENGYDESNRGVAFFTQVGGDWTEALQFRAAVDNRLATGARPVVGPLVEVLEGYHHHGVLLVDREHMRMMSLYMDQPLHEREVKTEPYPTPHDVKRGGYSARDYQQRKAEEVRHFFKEFAAEVGDFVRRYSPDDLILLGTDENVKKFLDFLPDAVKSMVVHTAHAPIDAPVSDILERIRPFFEEMHRERTNEAVSLLRDRVAQNHLATAGFHGTLEHLQEGKVQTLVLARGLEREGSQCAKCSFILARRDQPCPYCGGEVRDGVDLAEEMVRMAAEQDAAIEFVPSEAVADLDGVGAILRF